MLCTITDGKGFALNDSDRLNTLSDELSEAIRTSARGGDMYARYSNNQFVVLLLDITQEDCVLVEARINENLSKESRKRYIKYHLAPVNLASAGTDNDTDELKDIVMEDKAGRNKAFDGVISDVSDLTPDNINLEYCENIRFQNVELIPRSL